MDRHFSLYILLLLCSALALAGCDSLPSSGFLRSDVNVPKAKPAERTNGIQVVAVDAQVARKLSGERISPLFSDAFGTDTSNVGQWIGPGDVLEISIWEVSPSTLFAAPSSATSN